MVRKRFGAKIVFRNTLQSLCSKDAFVSNVSFGRPVPPTATVCQKKKIPLMSALTNNCAPHTATEMATGHYTRQSITSSGSASVSCLSLGKSRRTSLHPQSVRNEQKLGHHRQRLASGRRLAVNRRPKGLYLSGCPQRNRGTKPSCFTNSAGMGGGGCGAVRPSVCGGRGAWVGGCRSGGWPKGLVGGCAVVARSGGLEAGVGGRRPVRRGPCRCRAAPRGAMRRRARGCAASATRAPQGTRTAPSHCRDTRGGPCGAVGQRCHKGLRGGGGG